MVFYAGLFKKSYLGWRAAPNYQGWYQDYAHKHANGINWLREEHPVVWGIAPTFPPEIVGENPACTAISALKSFDVPDTDPPCSWRNLRRIFSFFPSRDTSPMRWLKPASGGA